MEAFLKKYSTVPNGFITDFFNISKEMCVGTDFSINFDIVVKWLNVRKDNLKRVLEHNFELNYDYKIEKNKTHQQNSGGGNLVHEIIITSDCFKELCMISQTKRAKEVRKYFLAVEKLVVKYNKHIQDALEKKIGMIKNNQKPKINKKGGIIYILEAQNTDVTLYKLGKTTDIRNRLNTYNSGNANDVIPLFIFEVDDIDKIENCIKLILKDFQYRKYKEVYEVDLDVIKKACEKCDSFINGFKQVIAESKTKKDKAELGRQIKKLKTTNKKLFLHIDKK
jgi:phage anti-repressor protein